jgi:hypothetical protein
MTQSGFRILQLAADRAAARRAEDCPGDISASTPVVIMLDLIELGAVDLWIADQPDPKPSRSEAVRRILDQALAR